jgi:hypothetical protein
MNTKLVLILMFLILYKPSPAHSYYVRDAAGTPVWITPQQGQEEDGGIPDGYYPYTNQKLDKNLKGK